MPQCFRGFGRALPAATAAFVISLIALDLHTTTSAANRSFGFIVDNSDRGLVVGEVPRETPAAVAGLQVGDQLLRMNGVEVRTFADYDRIAAFFVRDQVVPLVLDRQGTEMVLEVVAGHSWPLWDTLVSPLISMILLVGGFLALFRGSGFLNGRLFFLLSTALAVEWALPLDGVGRPVLDVAAWALFYILVGCQIGLEIHFVLLTPQRPEWLRTWRWVIPAIYTGAVGYMSLVALVWLAENIVGRQLGPLDATTLSNVYDQWLLPLWALTLLCSLLLRVFRYVQAEGRIQTGILLAGFLPWILATMIDALAAFLALPSPISMDWVYPLTNLTIPLAMGIVLMRESYRQTRLFLGLGRAVQDKVALSEISDLVGETLDQSLHPSWTEVFYLRQPDLALTLGHTSGRRRVPASVPDLDALMDFARRHGRPFDCHVLASRPPEARPLPAAEQRWLDARAPDLIVPMTGTSNRLAGLILLGPKKSEEPYSHRDRRLLDSVAGHIAIVLENLQLRENADRDRDVQRRILARLEKQDLHPVKECPRCRRCFDSGEEYCPDDEAELELSLAVERLVEGRYRLDRVLGRGGMGAVYEACDARLDRQVALKVMLDIGDAESLRRFQREARLSARLSHPNIVAVHDYGSTAGGGGFLVMEHLAGLSLRQALDRDGLVEVSVLAAWFDQILDGLEAAHDERIVHRDLKPSNIFLVGEASADSLLKILDFGLAKLRQPTVTSLTQLTTPGTLLGTLYYMAPEQLQGLDIDERADLFSVGVMVAEAITGELPFQGSSLPATISAILQQEFQLRGTSEETAELNRVLKRCLTKWPEKRYSSARELRRELIPALRRCPPEGRQSVRG